jgi:hypothetical protein
MHCQAVFRVDAVSGHVMYSLVRSGSFLRTTIHHFTRAIMQGLLTRFNNE